MSDSIQIESILLEIKKNSHVTAKSGAVASYSMRKPELYWELGITLNKIAEQRGVPPEERREWASIKYAPLEKKIWGEEKREPISAQAVSFVYEFQDKDYYMFVAGLAGHKWKKFVKKKLTYLRYLLSKTKPSLSSELQEKLIAKLSEKNYTLPEFTDILKEYSRKSEMTEILESFYELRDMVEEAMNDGANERQELRESIGSTVIEQIRYALQLLKMNEQSFERAYKIAKSTLTAKAETKIVAASVLSHYLKKIITSAQQREKFLKHIHQSDIGALNMMLHVLKSEENYKDYEKKQQALREIFG